MQTLHCAECGAELQPWETVYTWEGALLCEDCIDAKFDALTRNEKAELLGSEPVRAEDFMKGASA